MSEFHTASNLQDIPQGFSFDNVHRNEMMRKMQQQTAGAAQTHFPQVTFVYGFQWDDIYVF